MKKYIRYILASHEIDNVDTSMFDGTPFKPDTGTSYYNNFLNAEDLKYMQEHKNRTGYIIMMSPDEYFKESANKIFSNRHTVEEILHSREYDSELNEEYTEAMRNGSKFPLCYLNYADNTQEGLHRMLVAGNLYGWQKEFPVLVVTVFDQPTEDRWQMVRNCNEFLHHEFHSVCEEALDDLIDWKSPPPNDFERIYKENIINTALKQDEGYMIDVEIEIRPDTENEFTKGDSIVEVYLTQFGDYELPVISNPYTFYLSEYFKVGEDKSDSETHELDNVDDIDLLDLFIK